MTEYVAFKCSICSTEASSLEALEGHIWNRHLGSFQYYCAECNYPALNSQALRQHFLADHPSSREIEFRRKLSLDLKLREIISSSMVVSFYEEEEEPIYSQNEVPQVAVIEEVGSESAITETIPIEDMDVIHNQADLIESQEGALIYVKEGDYPCGTWDDQEPGAEIIDLRKQEVVTLTAEAGTLVDCDADDSYPIYSGHDLLDESYHYVDEEGNTIYVTDQYQYEEEEKLNEVQRRSTKHRNIDAVVNEIAQVSKKPKRPTTIWTCPECNKTIKYPSKIEEHKRMHARVKPFTCKFCDSKFAHKGALKCHERTHKGIRPYACTWDCGKSFVSSSAQRMHERYHSGQKSFMCTMCGRLFSKRNHLIRHENAVHMGQHLEPIEDDVEPRGLEVAGSAKRILAPIIEGIIEEVKDERQHRRMIRLGLREEEEEIV